MPQRLWGIAMFYLRTRCANKLIGFALVASGAVGLALSWWLKRILHVPEGHVANSGGGISGLAIGIGISFVAVGFSSDLEASDCED